MTSLFNPPLLDPYKLLCDVIRLIRDAIAVVNHFFGLQLLTDLVALINEALGDTQNDELTINSLL